MYLDANLLFDPAGTAITASAVSTNVLDLGVARDLGPGLYPESVVVVVGTSFTGTGGSTLTIQVEGAPDNGSGSPGTYEILYQSQPVALASLVAGQKAFDAPLAVVAPQGANGLVLPRFLRLNYIASTSFTGGTVTSFLGGDVDRNYSYKPGVVVSN